MTIISNIQGGLGNQMFQYAMGMAVAKRNNVDFFLDTNLYHRRKFHNGFELGSVFNISSREASKSEIKTLLGWKALPLNRKLLNKKFFNSFRGRNFYLENGLTINEKVFTLSENCYLSGYWQSEDYFSHYADLIRSEFVFRCPLSGINAEIAGSISNVDSVSLHVRRGDYVTNAHTNSVHGTCSINYYKRAMNYIESQLAEPKYFVFSDDIKWAKENLSIRAEHCFVEHNDNQDSYIDMQLMSICRHHIIANSSFSWWGAWLNQNKNKIVIAPERWFYSDGLASHTIVPQFWVTL